LLEGCAVSGIGGWHAPGAARPDADEVLVRMSRVLAAGLTEQRRTVSLGGGAVACSGRGSFIDVAEAPASRRLCGVVGRARFTDAALAAEAARAGVARTFLAAYEGRGAEALAVLEGAFAIALIDEKREEALLAIDRMGIWPMAYAVPRPGVFVFGSNTDALAAHPSVRVEIDPQALFDYIYFHVIPGPRTAIRGVTRLLPGTYALFRSDAVEVRPYWEMKYLESERVPFEPLRKHFVRTLRESVTDAASVGQVGAFLSGGTDSSTVAGLLTGALGEPAKTFSIGFDAAGYDEMAYARIAAKHFGTRQFEYYVGPEDVVSAIPRVAAAYDQPYGNASAVPTYYCARLAASEGVTHMLGGDGGDELFGGNARYATQYLLSLYTAVPDWLRAKLIEPLALRFPGAEMIPGMRKVRGYIRLASTPMPARLESYNLVERLGATRIFNGEFLTATDPGAPLRQLAETYGRAHARSLINLMLALDLKYTLADNDLPKVTRMCDLAGVDCSFPFLDERVVAFSAQLAPELKLKGTQLRYFFKKALRDFLPKEVIAKSKHGFGLPFGVWLEKHRPLRELAMDSLTDLKRRGIVRPDFIDELTSTLLANHPSYYGVMIWVLMMLEQWLKLHMDGRSAGWCFPSAEAVAS
jgi:asparagine synthase (glutamine-hydrolysing)